MENNEVWVDDYQFRQAVDSISKNISEGAESTQSAIAVKADANGFILIKKGKSKASSSTASDKSEEPTG